MIETIIFLSNKKGINIDPINPENSRLQVCVCVCFKKSEIHQKFIGNVIGEPAKMLEKLVKFKRVDRMDNFIPVRMGRNGPFYCDRYGPFHSSQSGLSHSCRRGMNGVELTISFWLEWYDRTNGLRNGPCKANFRGLV